MRFGYLLILTIIFYGLPARADEPDPDIVRDTIRLDGVTIMGGFFERFSAGSQIRKIDSAALAASGTRNLSDLIRSEAPVHFKSYGNGMLSSVSFRGTGAGHTAVMWNGINVNQPTVGQTDFSLFPVIAFDRVRLHYGASSARYGSEALGGAVLLDSKPDWNTGKFHGDIRGYAGSYGRYMIMGRASVRPADRLLSTTRFYRNLNENNFRFTNITKPGHPVERQENAAVSQYGVVQDLYFRPSAASQLSVKAWFNFTDRDIQPVMSNPDARESQEDKSLRIVADYEHEFSFGFVEAKAGYVWDYLLYNHQSRITTEQWIGQIGYENEINHWKFRIGLNHNQIGAISENYGDRQEEGRTAFSGGVVYSGIERMNVSLNVNQQFVSGYEPPVAPAFGIQYKMPVTLNAYLVIEGQASLNYRVPTLNDRYWKPGGNPELKPERSRNFEGTVTYELDAGIPARISLTGFHYHVDDWILWQPAGTWWVPENVRQVNASGLEIRSGITVTAGRSEFEFNGFYSMTRSVIAGGAGENAKTTGNQLPYTPVHLTGMNINWMNGSWSASVSGDYTGYTYITTGNETTLPGYFLVHVHGSRKFRIGGQLLAIDLRIDNLLNTDYQNVLYRAMPGRTYLGGFQFYFNQ